MTKVFYSLLFLCLGSHLGFAEMSLIERAEKSKQSLVEVKTVYERLMHTKDGDRMASYERSGAGVIIDPDGIIITNTHTIINAPHIFVILPDGTKLDAQVVFVAQGSDFSLIKVTPPLPLKPIAWAESSQIQLGEEILSIGNSDYDNHSILSGQVTSLIQSHSTGEIEFIVTNLNLYKGDSGGPIIDRQGRLLGIVMGKEKSLDRTSIAIASDVIRKEYIKYKQRNP